MQKQVYFPRCIEKKCQPLPRHSCRASYIVEIVIAPTRCGLEALICRWPCLRCVLLRRATAVCSEVSLGAFAKKSLGNSVLLMELRHTFCFYYSLYLRIH